MFNVYENEMYMTYRYDPLSPLWDDWTLPILAPFYLGPEKYNLET